jgi:chaperonin GroEL
MSSPAVLFNPTAQAQLKKGFDTLADLLALTLGPTRGHILATSDLRQNEMLGDAATIARRLIALPDRSEDVGAMILRNLVWRVHERVGDGSATTAVMAQAILDRAAKYIAAGANAMSLQRGVRKATDAALAALADMAQPISGEDDLTAVAQSVTGHDRLSLILGEMIDLLGERGHITIQNYAAPYLERAYIDGGQWKGQLASPYLITTRATQQAILNNVRVAVFAGQLSDAGDLIPLLNLIADETPPQILIVANKITGDALNTLAATHQKGAIKIVAVALNSPAGQLLRAETGDLALLTGARVFTADSGETLRAIQRADLGRARRVEAGAEGMVVTGGGGTVKAIREQIESLDHRLRSLDFDDKESPNLQKRLGRLASSVAILKIGALTEAERRYLHQKAEQGIKALRAAVEEGTVIGGGLAYIHCLPAVEALRRSISDDEALGVKAVMHGLEAPFLRILDNARVPAPRLILEDIRRCGSGYAFDAVRHRIAPAEEARIFDPAKVSRVALETAASGAMLALSTETVVLRKKPKVSLKP